MGNYATTTSISLKLPDIMDDNTTTTDTKFEETFGIYIDKAEAKFNSVAAKKYSLPFNTTTSIPPMARELSFEMAAWYTIRAFSTRDWPNRNEMIDDFANAFTDLDKIGKGELRLTLTDGSLISPLSGLIQSNRLSEDPTMDLDNPTNWSVDQTRLEELENSRQ